MTTNPASCVRLAAAAGTCISRDCWFGVFHNEDDAHAYRIKLEKEEELRQIGESA